MSLSGMNAHQQSSAKFRENKVVAIEPVGGSWVVPHYLVKRMWPIGAQPMGRPGWPKLAFSLLALGILRVAAAAATAPTEFFALCLSLLSRRSLRMISTAISESPVPKSSPIHHHRPLEDGT